MVVMRLRNDSDGGELIFTQIMEDFCRYLALMVDMLEP